MHSVILFVVASEDEMWSEGGIYGSFLSGLARILRASEGLGVRKSILTARHRRLCGLRSRDLKLLGAWGYLERLVFHNVTQ